MDHQIAFFIGRMVGRDQRVGTALTAELSFPIRVKTAYSLYKELYEERDPSQNVYPDRVQRNNKKVEDFGKLLGRAGQAMEKRNTFMHSIWTAGSPEITRIKYSAKKGVKFNSEIIEVKEIDSVAEEIEAVCDEFTLLLIDFAKECGDVQTIVFK